MSAVTPRVAIVTCVELPEPDPDQDLMLDLLRAADLKPSLVAWDDAGAEWSNYDLAVLRSCWNYHEHPDRFINWCGRAASGTMLLNPAPVVGWNIHKGYLRSLADAGLPVVPTAFVDRGETLDLGAMLSSRGWSDVVVKPCVSAGSARTRRFRDAAGTDASDAAEFAQQLADVTDTMIQPFIRSVETGGERSAVWINGQATHAIVKEPRFHEDDEQVSEAQPVLDAELRLLDAALPLVGEPLLYARLDTMRAEDGSLLISELELIEPSLFLLQSNAAQARFAEAVAHAAHRVVR